MFFTLANSLMKGHTEFSMTDLDSQGDSRTRMDLNIRHLLSRLYTCWHPTWRRRWSWPGFVDRSILVWWFGVNRVSVYYGLSMARVVRLEGEGAVYHVIVRGNERKAVFRDDEDRRGYLDRLA